MKIFFNIQLATSWNQLTELQLKEIVFSLEHYHNYAQLFPEEARPAQFSKLYVVLAKTLLRTNNWIKVWYALRQLPPEEYEPHVKFLLGEVARTKFLPAFKLKGTRHHPPGDRLQNLTIKEFSFADSLYYNWRKSKDARYLDTLCAVLYRKSSGSSSEIDIRREFNKIFVEKDVIAFQKLSLKKKLAIAYTYEGCRNYIVKQYPHIFPKPPEPTEEEKKNPQPTQAARYTPFGKLIHYKIQFDPSKLEQTQNLNIHDFFGPFENELIENKNNRK